MVLIFHLDISGSDFGRLMGSLHRSLLKYNALEEATSKNLLNIDAYDFHGGRLVDF
ncbi:unnamed protein product [Brassica oleracea var. botrytis]